MNMDSMIRRRPPVDHIPYTIYGGAITLFTIILLFLVMMKAPSVFPYFFVVSFITTSALLFSLWLVRWLMKRDDGDESMHQTSEPIRIGAEAFLRVMNGTIMRIALVVACAIFIIFLFRKPPPTPVSSNPSVPSSSTSLPSGLSLALATAFAFLVGSVFSAFAGYISMWVAVRANVRVASAASCYDYPLAMQIAIRGGAFTGLLVVGMCVLGLAVLFSLYTIIFTPSGATASARTPHLLVGYGFGASLVALFAQLGGGIYTKAADVGADMVGKVEANIPEDDPRNPAVIADLVGDNVGDCAGRGADLFESIGGEMIGAMILGADLAAHAGLSNPTSFIFFPLILHSFDLVISSIAVMFTSPRVSRRGRRVTPESPSAGGPSAYNAAHDALENAEDPLSALVRAYILALGQAAVVLLGLCYFLLNPPAYPSAWWKFYLCGLIGCAMSLFFVQATKYYTDYSYSPVLRIVSASRTGAGTNVIMGVAVGLESSALPALMIAASLIAAYHLGNACGITDAHGAPTGGLFGTAVATMGMLSTAVYVLAMDTFGPITDNAGGIVEMAELPPSVRAITDRLDAVGNVTKATTKGYSIGAAGLASFLLFRAFLDVVNEFIPARSLHLTRVDIATPEVFIGGFLGGALVFLFASLAISAVGRSAEQVVSEVRLQFQMRPGILQGRDRPDYDKCIALVTQSALREMTRPGAVAVLGPILVGVVGRIVGQATGRPLLGVEMVASFLLFATGTGILLALFLNNAGGAWDNAKKYIESAGSFGGKGSEAHKAAVTGDTVGDPFKDTAGPSIHVLIKLLATITLVSCPLLLPSF